MSTKQLFTLLFAALTLAASVAQTPNPSPISQAYHEYRQQTTDPPYGLSKVKALIARLKPGNNDMDNGALSASKYSALSTSEKFTYTMLHGENQDQNCDAMPGIVDEEKKLFGHPLNGFNDQAQWSDRQHAFLKNHRSQVISLLRSTIKLRHRVGVNLKQAILELDAWELIPDTLDVFKSNRKDLDILSVCMILMKDGHYKPFLQSTTYKKLYADVDASWQAFVVGNVANQDLEMKRAMGYYNSKR